MDSARVILVALLFTSPFIVIHAVARWNAAAVATTPDDCKTQRPPGTRATLVVPQQVAIKPE
jgi:hypothetical protein